jgi:hypothetical protein
MFRAASRLTRTRLTGGVPLRKGQFSTSAASTISVNGTTFSLPAPGEHYIAACFDGLSQVRLDSQ